MAHIKIIDQPCGWGKSTRILDSFEKPEKYIVVAPYLSEVQRYIEGAKQRSGFILTQPLSTEGNKTSHCERLIRDGKSVVCTHNLFYRLGEMATRPMQDVELIDWDGVSAPHLKTRNMLSSYNLVIDEVVEPLKPEPLVREVDFKGVYQELDLATVTKDGRVHPTERWDKLHREGCQALSRELYEKAKSGALYKLSDALFILTIPTELLLAPKMVTIYTYLSEGSLLRQFLEMLQRTDPSLFTLEIEKLDQQAEAEWREDVMNALTIRSIPELEGTRWNHSSQIKDFKSAAKCKRIGWQLRKFQTRELQGIDPNNVMLTCARELWFSSKSGEKPHCGKLSKHTRLFGRPESKIRHCSDTDREIVEWSTSGVTFVPNTTRGTNRHAHCTQAVYLYDQNPNPQLITFLGWKRDSVEARAYCDAYALTELVQWLFRSALRKGGVNGTPRAHEPRKRVTVYIPSERMRNLLVNWLVTGTVHSGPPKSRCEREMALMQQLTNAA
jgi:hypothetical protein